ncbi:MAG: hypothetical protein K940chlam3_00105 [Chlamydiae bacterium]|nr:hypothetical protein [Chlamydiota bacterium]
MKKLLDRRSAILKREYRRHRDDFWTDEEPSITRIVHKKTGFIITKSKFNTRNTLQKRGKIRYEINIEDF